MIACLCFDRDGLSFHYRDEGDGLPFVFQHGLGGDLSQPFGVYRPAAGVRLIGFDFRGHGETRPLGDDGEAHDRVPGRRPGRAAGSSGD